MSNWDKGSYEFTAAQIEPVAPVVANAVEPVAGQPTLDLACGTGNVSLELARRGASVTGFDGAPRLLKVAGERAAAEGFEATWVQGDLAELPFADDSFEIVTSVFGVIFHKSKIPTSYPSRHTSHVRCSGWWRSHEAKAIRSSGSEGPLNHWGCAAACSRIFWTFSIPPRSGS